MFLEDDYLGKAAEAKHGARQAIKDKRYDDAWRLLHEQQSELMKHASLCGFTPQQTLSSLSSINEDLANILRLENKKDQALVHILYCVSSSSRPTQSQNKKLDTYFRRCKFGSGITAEDMENAVKKLKKNPDIRVAQNIVSEWRNSN